MMLAFLGPFKLISHHTLGIILKKLLFLGLAVKRLSDKSFSKYILSTFPHQVDERNKVAKEQ